jgi:hypothetical protein
MTTAKTQTKAQQIAGVIFDQLGARRFIMMTGARDICACKEGLQFRLPANFAKDGINMMRVELDGLDTYTVIAGRWSRLEFNEKRRESGIYSEDLQRTFTRLTGLDAELGVTNKRG